MTNRTSIYIMIGFLLLAGTALGGLDQSGDKGAKNLSMADFSALGVDNNAENDITNAGAPEATAADPGTEVAAYTDQAPPAADLDKLMPSSITTNPPRYMYYNGDYLSWSDFSATFSGNQPGLWIERAVSWSLYATLPLGGWTQELLYVPTPTPLTMYEIYSGGFVIGYNLGYVQPGYYYVWYYADTLGRHRNVFATSTGYSNAVIIDVYPVQPYPKPIKPDPKKECEKNPNCHYVNGNCYCTMPAPDPKKECESKSYCHWVNGQCLCTMPDPEKEQCESNPLCDYVDGHCYCRGLKPEPEPQPAPMPGPVPNPNPEPYNPAPNPVAECEQNPSCHWVNGQCLCTGLNPIGSSEESDSTGDLGATASGTNP
ncbi:MAG: hypothetical protein WB392_13390 [Methanotrichaceae archaeon]